MQHSLSSFDIYVIVSELQDIVDCHIDKIYQLSRNEILIRVKNIQTKEKHQIFIRNGELLSITDKQIETPKKPSTFAMTLRKYLSNGRIIEITQHEFDRIIKFKISKKEGNYTLVVEFFSDGNIILVDPDDKIILPFIRQSWAHRKLKGREPYVPPPDQINPFDLTLEKFKDLIKESSSDLVRTLAVSINLSGYIAEEICVRANVNKNLLVSDVDDAVVAKTFNALISFLKIFQDKKFEPVLVKKNDDVVDILPFKFKSYKGYNFEKTLGLAGGLERFISVKKQVVKKTDVKTDKLVGKLNRQFKQQLEAVESLEKQIEEKKFEGDLIYLNYQVVEDLLSEVKSVLELKDKEEAVQRINEKDIVKKFDPEDNLLIMLLKNTDNEIFEIRINFRKSVSENAKKAYDNSKKLRSKRIGAEKSLIKTQEHLDSVKKMILKERKLEESKKPVVKEKMFWFERFRWFISSDGNIVIGGKDAKTNELAVKKYLKQGDRYAHADIQGAPSIIIKGKGVTDDPLSISNQTLEEACVFAASYSKAWKQFAEAQSYWVLPEQVSKTAESGEFVPHGAFIIRGKRNYHRCKLEVAVGIVEIDGEIKIMGGPVNAVRNRSSKYVILVPGDMKKSDAARTLGKAFNASVESIDRTLPPGGVNVVETAGVDL